jgi:prevent-host-death family protein
MHTGIRALKAHLSEYIHRAADGEDITVSVRGRAVVKLVAAGRRQRASIKSLTNEPGISWCGGKPAGVARPRRLSGSASLSGFVVEDRR